MKKNYPALPRFPAIYPGAGGVAVPTPASPDGLEASRISGAGARLPLGAAVAGPIPGLYESGAENPPDLAGTDPVVDPENPTAPAPLKSRFTLVQAGPAPAPARTAGGFIMPPGQSAAPSIAAAGPAAGVDPLTLTGTATGVDVNQPGGVDLMAWGKKNGVLRPGEAPSASSIAAAGPGGPGAALSPAPSSIAAAGPNAPTTALPAPAANPTDDLTRNATALALQRIMTAGPTGGVTAGPGSGGGGGPGGIDPTLAPLGNAGRLMTAAAGLEGNKLDFASRDIIARMGPQAPLATDTPEVRKGKFAYFQKVMADETARDPTLRTAGAGGGAASTQDLAQTFNKLMAEGQGPQYRRVGTDAEGRAIEGTLDRNGNFSRISPEKTGASPLKKLLEERDTYAKAGNTEAVDHYNNVIKTYGAKFDIYGQPITANAGYMDPLEKEGLPTVTTKAQRAGLKPGSRYVDADGKIVVWDGQRASPYTGEGAAAGGATVVPSGPVPTADAIAHLVANPALASQFDAKYGAAASKRYIR